MSEGDPFASLFSSANVSSHEPQHHRHLEQQQPLSLGGGGPGGGGLGAFFEESGGGGAPTAPPGLSSLALPSDLLLGSDDDPILPPGLLSRMGGAGGFNRGRDASSNFDLEDAAAAASASSSSSVLVDALPGATSGFNGMGGGGEGRLAVGLPPGLSAVNTARLGGNSELASQAVERRLAAPVSPNLRPMDSAVGGGASLAVGGATGSGDGGVLSPAALGRQAAATRSRRTFALHEDDAADDDDFGGAAPGADDGNLAPGDARSGISGL